jgi:hypothetical protein
MKMMAVHPELLGKLSLFTLKCINYLGHCKTLISPTSSANSIAMDSTASSPYTTSDWERTTYYHGISPN